MACQVFGWCARSGVMAAHELRSARLQVGDSRCNAAARGTRRLLIRRGSFCASLLIRGAQSARKAPVLRRRRLHRRRRKRRRVALRLRGRRRARHRRRSGLGHGVDDARLRGVLRPDSVAAGCSVLLCGTLCSSVGSINRRPLTKLLSGVPACCAASAGS